MEKEAKVLVLGGGIHGAGVLHDLASRGVSPVYLIEKNTLGSGTSSKSTKLIHGGLRYLERLGQFGMVQESLKERKLLLSLAPDLVKPIEFLIPIHEGSSFESLKMKVGLGLYDLLAQTSLIEPNQTLTLTEAYEKAPVLRGVLDLKKIYSYWDAQTDDRLLVQKVARSGEKLGGRYFENSKVLSLKNFGKYFEVVFENEEKRHTIKATYIINCLGPWSNKFLESNGFVPTHKGKNNKGTHIVLGDRSLKSALLLKAIDKRIFFMIPWFGKTLIGTTEKAFDGDPSFVEPACDEIFYLLESVRSALNLTISESEIEYSFSGLRWLLEEEGKSLTKTSRESTLGMIKNESGFILTIYGGKLTSYRSLCEKIGNLVLKNEGIDSVSKTHLKEFWV